jgi:pre-mRNA cleavage complex 2 protein Pcf11
VKNVPTPYALYFGPKLYSIFMGAYAKVDNNTRKKMDEMLKTWKEPVPGSISTKPVFPPEHVRPIEMALIGARNAAYAANQNSFRPGGRPAAVVAPPHRETPTPPNIARPPSTHQQPPYHAPPHNGHPGEVPYAMRPMGVRIPHSPALLHMSARIVADTLSRAQTLDSRLVR